MTLEELEDQVRRGVIGAENVLKILRKIRGYESPVRHARVKPLPPEIGHSTPQRRKFSPEVERKRWLEHQRDLEEIDRKRREAQLERKRRKQERLEAAALKRRSSDDEAHDTARRPRDSERGWANPHPWDDEVDYSWGEGRYRTMLGSGRSTDFIGPWQHSREFSYLFEDPPDDL